MNSLDICQVSLTIVVVGLILMTIAWFRARSNAALLKARLKASESYNSSILKWINGLDNEVRRRFPNDFKDRNTGPHMELTFDYFIDNLYRLREVIIKRVK